MKGTEDAEELREKLVRGLMENLGMSQSDAEWEVGKLIRAVGAERNVQLLKSISPEPQTSKLFKYVAWFNRAERRKKIGSSPRYTQKKKGRKKK